jgi:hypothetical protein
MATPRVRQAHDRRVDKIAEEAAAAIASDSPVEEEVVVTVEERPLSDGAPVDSDRRRSDAVQSVVFPFLPGEVMGTMAAVAQANIVFWQRSVAEQLRFVACVTDALAASFR